MLNEQEQKILDNAPEWAEYHMIHNELQTDYAIKVNGRYFDNNANSANPYGTEFVFGMWLITSLADLRKKQGKTVVDAVNYYQADIPKLYVSDFVNQSNNYYVTFIDGAFDISEDEIDGVICGSFDFNKCVREMGEAEWLNPGFPCDYKLHTKNFKPVKPRMKIEYVKVVADDFVIASLFASETVYYMSSNSHDSHGTQYSEITNLDQLACASHVYRKIETEITWVNSLASWFDTIKSKPAGTAFATFRSTLGDAEFSDEEFIEMCHLVSSMNK